MNSLSCRRWLSGLICLIWVQTGQTQQPIEEIVVRPTLPADGSLVLSSSREYLPPASLADLLLSSPAIALVGQGGHLQTFAVRGLSQERIRILLNEAPLRPLRRAGVSAAFLNPAWMTVAVDPTAAPTTQGSGAIGGTVFTSPIDNPPDQITLRFEGPDNRRSLNAIGSARNFTAAAGYEFNQDQRAADGTRLNTSFEQLSLLLRHSRATDSMQRTSTVLFSNGSDIGKSNSDYPLRTTSYPRDRHLFISQEFSHHQHGHLSAWLHAQELQTKTSRDQVRTDVDASVVDYGLRLNRSLQQTSTRSLTAGVDLFGRGNYDVREDSASTLRDGSNVELGAWIDAHQIVDRWHLTWGLRALYDRCDADAQPEFDSSRLLGHAGFGWQVSQSFGWRFNIRRATTLPTTGQLYFTGTTGRGQIVGNRNLDAEDSWIYELSTSGSLHQMTYNLSGFFMDIDSFIQKEELQPDLDTFSNSDGGQISGFLGELKLELNMLTFEAGVSILRGDLDDGGALPDIPANQATLRSHWPVAGGTAALEVAQRFSSNRVAQGNRKEDARTLLSASYRRSFSRQLEITLFGRNLLDELYYVSGDDKSALGTQRTLGISISALL